MVLLSPAINHCLGLCYSTPTWRITVTDYPEKVVFFSTRDTDIEIYIRDESWERGKATSYAGPLHTTPSRVFSPLMKLFANRLLLGHALHCRSSPGDKDL